MSNFAAPEGLPEVTAVSPVKADPSEGDRARKRNVAHVERAHADGSVAIAPVRRDEPIVTRKVSNHISAADLGIVNSLGLMG